MDIKNSTLAKLWKMMFSLNICSINFHSFSWIEIFSQNIFNSLWFFKFLISHLPKTSCKSICARSFRKNDLGKLFGSTHHLMFNSHQNLDWVDLQILVTAIFYQKRMRRNSSIVVRIIVLLLMYNNYSAVLQQKTNEMPIYQIWFSHFFAWSFSASALVGYSVEKRRRRWYRFEIYKPRENKPIGM